MKKRITVVLMMLGMIPVLAACGGGNADVVRIGTQTYTEVKILAEMDKALIEENTDLSVEITQDLASSPVVVKAMQNDEIDLATLYTGEVFNNYFEFEPTHDRRAVYEIARDGFDEHLNMTWLEPFGFENTYAFTVRADVAESGGYETISDLAQDAANMRLGVDTTWLERTDIGYKPFIEHYGFEFGQTFPMEIGLVYEAVANDEVDVVLAYSSDSRIMEFNLKTLADDKQFFPPYDAAAVARNELFEAHPEVKEAISVLSGNISLEEMVALNYEVDVKKRSESEVAVEFLVNKGLLSE
jgi:osmoprotectant transport system substrate-binding protein